MKQHTYSFAKSLLGENQNSLQSDLKNVDKTDAGSKDVVNKAHSTDVKFTNMRNAINAQGGIAGSDIADYIEQAEELNDDIDTVAYGLETADGHVVKVYVNAEQSDEFETALSNMLGVEEDIEETLNRLAGEYDIVDVVWPKGAVATDVKPAPENGGDGPLPGDSEVDIENYLSGNIPPGVAGLDNDDDDDEYEIIAALPGMDQRIGSTLAPVQDNTSSETDPEALPDVEETPEGGIWAKLNDEAIAQFGQEEGSEVLGISDLTPEQLDKLIDMERANEIAVNEYEAADFLGLEEDEQEEIIEANPDLVRGGEEEPDTTEEPDVNKEEEPDEEEPPAKEEIPESKNPKRFSFLASL